MEIVVNSIKWEIILVNPNDINLITNDGNYTLGMTDNNIKCIFLSNKLDDDLLYNVLCHELCHVYCFSYNIYMDIEDEERLAQFISDFGKSIIKDTHYLLTMLFHNDIL